MNDNIDLTEILRRHHRRVVRREVLLNILAWSGIITVGSLTIFGLGVAFMIEPSRLVVLALVVLFVAWAMWGANRLFLK